jgi:hypothetical protein
MRASPPTEDSKTSFSYWPAVAIIAQHYVWPERRELVIETARIQSSVGNTGTSWK